jgi:hypothetical protein
MTSPRSAAGAGARRQSGKSDNRDKHHVDDEDATL